MSKREVSYIISVSDRASAGFRKVAEGSRKARREVEGLESAAEDAGDAIEDAFDGDAVEGLSEELDKARRKTRQLGDEAKESGRGFGGMAKEAKKFVKVLAAAEVTKFFVKQGKAAVDAAAQIESYQATLETMLGSTQAARDRMEEYKDIAKITPFGLEDVVEGGNQLQAIGRYSRENLEMLGDLAAATNKPMEQVMNAYAKLATGQKGEASRMFQDLFINRDDWIAATGKGVSKSGELLASTKEMMAALPKIMQSKGYLGMMAKQAEKANGMFSNLKDSAFSLKAALGEQMMPTVKNVVGGLTRMVNSMERVVRVPLAEKIGREKAELNLLVGQLMDANTKEERRKEIIDELNRNYKGFLDNIDLEKGKTEDLRKKLEQVNAEYDKRIRNAVLADRMESLKEDEKEAWKDYTDIVMSQKARERNEQLALQMAQLLRDHGIDISSIDYFGFTSGHVTKNPNKKKNGLKRDYGASLYVDKKGNFWYHPYGENSKLISDEDLLAALSPLYYEWLGNYEFYKSSDSKEDEKKKLANYNKVKSQREALKRLASMDDEEGGGGGQNGGQNGGGGADSDETTGGSTPTTVAGTTYSGGSGSGGGSGKTVTTNIGTLVGTIEIHTTTLQEGAAEVKRLVTQALLEAVPSDL